MLRCKIRQGTHICPGSSEKMIPRMVCQLPSCPGRAICLPADSGDSAKLSISNSQNLELQKAALCIGCTHTAPERHAHSAAPPGGHVPFSSKKFCFSAINPSKMPGILRDPVSGCCRINFQTNSFVISQRGKKDSRPCAMKPSKQLSATYLPASVTHDPAENPVSKRPFTQKLSPARPCLCAHLCMIPFRPEQHRVPSNGR